MATRTSERYSGGKSGSRFKVDANGEQIRAHRTNHRGIDSLADGAKSRPWIVFVEYHCNPGPPVTTNLDPDVRVGGDVADVTGLMTMLRDDPECRAVSVHPVAYRVAPPINALAPGRFNQCV